MIYTSFSETRGLLLISKMANVAPIHKKSMQFIENNYRSVSQLPVYVKILGSSISYEIHPNFFGINLYADVQF